MPVDKSKNTQVLVTFPNGLFEEIENVQFEDRFKNRNEAIRSMVTESIAKRYGVVDYAEGDELESGFDLLQDETGKKYLAPAKSYEHLNRLGFEKVKEQSE